MADIVCHFIRIQSPCQIDANAGKNLFSGHKVLLCRYFLTDEAACRAFPVRQRATTKVERPHHACTIKVLQRHDMHQKGALLVVIVLAPARFEGALFCIICPRQAFEGSGMENACIQSQGSYPTGTA
ncbi:hypothetical protein [Kushneria pakistanensis]|uniref:hypothetical protein n=1 Tax=Kushneria pakistanensis TaxID=1508770 RepID=UPI001676BC0E|nr:hypothetical protein [Kushneria pakistanensis]